MTPRTCTDTTDGPCPNSPLGGVDTCLQHTPPGAPVKLGGLLQPGRPVTHPDPTDLGGIVLTMAWRRP